MATKKVTELTALTNAASGDLLLIVDDPLGSPETKKITVADFFSKTNSFLSNLYSLIICLHSSMLSGVRSIHSSIVFFNQSNFE